MPEGTAGLILLLVVGLIWTNAKMKREAREEREYFERRRREREERESRREMKSRLEATIRKQERELDDLKRKLGESSES